MPYSSAARTNLSSHDVRISNRKVGEGTFRECFKGTYIGGERNNQEAACKRFKQKFRSMEMEYFENDFAIANTAIDYAEGWNQFCEHDEEILITKGHIVHSNDGVPYLVEPVIRDFKKFTSNSGWIDHNGSWTTEMMEAFSHYTYDVSGEQHLVCDLQGRYRDNRRFHNGKSRFELTDVAICSRDRSFGPTDLGEKGIESFFANHQCNEFCQHSWLRPEHERTWFPRNSSCTSMFASRDSYKLESSDRTLFTLGRLGNIVETECEDWTDSSGSLENIVETQYESDSSGWPGNYNTNECQEDASVSSDSSGNYVRTGYAEIEYQEDGSDSSNASENYVQTGYVETEYQEDGSVSSDASTIYLRTGYVEVEYVDTADVDTGEVDTEEVDTEEVDTEYQGDYDEAGGNDNYNDDCNDDYNNDCNDYYSDDYNEDYNDDYDDDDYDDDGDNYWSDSS